MRRLYEALSLPSPIQKINLKPYLGQDYFIWIKREDLIHSEFGGNKWRKLQGNIEHCKSHDLEGIITFGGPFSNHIAATASVSQIAELDSIGIIRGSYVDPHNPTLIKAQGNGMTLHHVSKDLYGLKEASSWFHEFKNDHPKYLVIPEGGSNTLALNGLSVLSQEIESQGSFDSIYVSGGTGTTSAGIIKYISDSTYVSVINVLKNKSLSTSIDSLVQKESSNWKVLENYHRGGFAKVDKTLVDFINSFYKSFNIWLDPIYNAKVMYALLELIKNRLIQLDQKILVIHTGGLQGITAYNYLNKGILK